MTLQPWLYVTLLGLVFIVYAQLLPKQAKPAAGPGGDMMKDLEQSMEMFASDMEEQNEALLQLFSETKRDYEGHLAKLSGRLEQLEKQNAQLVQELTKARPNTASFIPPESAATERLQTVQTDQAAPPSQTVLSDAFPASGEALKLRQAVEESEDATLYNETRSTSRKPLLLNVKERYPDLFLLHEQNKSVEQIAKKLSMNKGEVQLILQLAVREEKADV